MPQRLTPDTDLIESVCENDRSVPHMLGGTGTKMAPEVLSKYTGTYEFAAGQPAVITIEGDLLFLQVGTNPLKLPLVADTGECLHLTHERGSDRIPHGCPGTVTGFIFHQGGGDQKAVRKSEPVQNPKHGRN